MSDIFQAVKYGVRCFVIRRSTTVSDRLPFALKSLMTSFAASSNVSLKAAGETGSPLAMSPSRSFRSSVARPFCLAVYFVAS